MPLFPLNNYKLVIGALIAIIVASLLTWVYLLKADLKVAKADYKAIESALTTQSNILEANRADYERNLAEASKTNTVVQTRFKDRVKVIYEIGEKHEDCNGSMYSINHYNF